jgi:hypothetical protein
MMNNGNSGGGEVAKASQRNSAKSRLVGTFPVRRLPRVPVGAPFAGRPFLSAPNLTARYKYEKGETK